MLPPFALEVLAGAVWLWLPSQSSRVCLDEPGRSNHAENQQVFLLAWDQAWVGGGHDGAPRPDNSCRAKLLVGFSLSKIQTHNRNSGVFPLLWKNTFDRGWRNSYRSKMLNGT